MFTVLMEQMPFGMVKLVAAVFVLMALMVIALVLKTGFYSALGNLYPASVLFSEFSSGILIAWSI